MRPREQFLVFGSPMLEEAEVAEVVASMRTGWLGTGPKVARFEKDFQSYKGSKYTVAVNSCTAALHLCLLSLDLQPGDEVITTALTFCSTVNAIIHAGARPVLADIDLRTMNIDPEQVAALITSRTRAILPVHFAGRPCDMTALMTLARRHGLKVIEDCAHAIETEYLGQKAGTLGDFGCFSFYSTKNIVTGEGGMVVTDDEDMAARIKILALHGMSRDAWTRFSDKGYKHYQVVAAGFKYNMMDLQAAIGIHQLQRVETYLRCREKVWDRYDDAFASLPITCPTPPDPGTRHARHLYTILIDDKAAGINRDSFLERMTEQRIGVGVHYMSIPEHPYYKETYGWQPEDYPHAMRVGRQTVSLPISAKLTAEDIEDVIGAVTSLLK